MRVSHLADGVLDGLDVVDAGAPTAVGAQCAALGARVHVLDPQVAGEPGLAVAVAGLAAATVLVVGSAPGLASGDAVAGIWNVVRAVGARQREAGYGKVVMLAPAPGDHPQAIEARAALDNLARTTAVEWARFGIRVVAVLPGDATPPGDLAELVAFLASPAGDYLSGCSLELDAVSASS